MGEEDNIMSTLLLIDTRRKLEQGQDIFRAKTVKALIGELEAKESQFAALRARIAQLEQKLDDMKDDNLTREMLESELKGEK
jgi:cell division protein FtsB